MTTKQLLVIEDNEDHQTLIKTVLKLNTDWKIVVVSDGVEGIAKAELERPDVILLDFIMLGLDGFTVCEILKSNLFTSSIPIIFMTAMVYPQTITRLENTLAEGIITKPFDIDNLHLQIAEICQW